MTVTFVRKFSPDKVKILLVRVLGSPVRLTGGYHLKYECLYRQWPVSPMLTNR